MGWIIDQWIKNQMTGAVHAFIQIFVHINGISGVLLTLPIIKDLTYGAQIVAISILAVKCTVEGYIHHVLRQAGDPGSDMSGMVIGAASAAGMILIGPELLKKMYHFAVILSNGVNGIGSATFQKITISSLFEQLILHLLEQILPGSNLILFLLVIGILLMMGLVLMQAFVRGGELALASLAVPFSALGLTNRNSAAFKDWIRESWAICAATVVHLAIFKLAVFTLIYYSRTNPIYGLCFFLGLLWVAYKSPATLRRYIHSTGAGQLAGSTLRAGSAVAFRRAFSFAS